MEEHVMQSMDSSEGGRQAGAHPLAALVVVLTSLFVTYLVVGLSGYGGDSDTYHLIRSGQTLLLRGEYSPSRAPGYFVAEVVIGAASLLGGFHLCNLISSLLGVLTLFVFWRLLTLRFSPDDSILMTIIVGLNPSFIIAASSSMDFVYSLSLGLLGVFLFATRRPCLGAVAFALATSARLSNVLVLAVAYLYFVYVRYASRDFKELRGVVASGFVGILATLLLYMPLYAAYNNTFGFLTYIVGDWDFLGHLSRFVYKNVYLLGLLPFGLIAGSAVWRLARRELVVPIQPEVVAGLAALLAHEVLFFKIPNEASYLLPILFVIVPLWGVLCRPGKIALYLMLLLTVVYAGVVNVDILDKRYENLLAVEAHVGVYLRPGVVVVDVTRRDEGQRKFGSRLLVQ
jgi:hypothetical protein